MSKYDHLRVSHLCDAHAFGVGAILDAQRRVHSVAGADQNVLDAGLDENLNVFRMCSDETKNMGRGKY